MVVPDGQGRHSTVASTSANVPNSQGVQGCTPPAGEYEPGEHFAGKKQNTMRILECLVKACNGMCLIYQLCMYVYLSKLDQIADEVERLHDGGKMI